KALEWYQKASENGNVNAQYSLGDMYFDGKVVEQDYSLAKIWLEKAAEQNDPYAQWNLGVIYFNGYDVKKDTEKAKELFKKACENGIKHEFCEQK
ncbi:MAG: sel1 repeat family protein, partial [Gilliamella sp.]|uniref:tetratricopeptide repeat protein n=1 Tax=Gilliamella sp. TaxID=1891236 RepID=UPI0025D159F6